MKKETKNEKEKFIEKLMEKGKKIALASKDKDICEIIKKQSNY